MFKTACLSVIFACFFHSSVLAEDDMGKAKTTDIPFRQDWENDFRLYAKEEPTPANILKAVLEPWPTDVEKAWVARLKVSSALELAEPSHEMIGALLQCLKDESKKTMTIGYIRALYRMNHDGNRAAKRYANEYFERYKSVSSEGKLLLLHLILRDQSDKTMLRFPRNILITSIFEAPNESSRQSAFDILTLLGEDETITLQDDKGEYSGKQLFEEAMKRIESVHELLEPFRNLPDKNADE